VFELVERPSNKNVIESRWVFFCFFLYV